MPVKQKQTIYCRWAPSLGALEGTHQEVWGTKDYSWKHRNKPCVFFGMYDLRDYLALWQHKGKAWVLWAGGDIRNLRTNFVFNDGKLKWLSILFAGIAVNFRDFLIKHILNKAEHWVENEAEAWQLKDIGLKVSGICPSFLGNIKKYKVSFKRGNNVYLSTSKDREGEYGWGIIQRIACALPEIEFRLFGTDPNLDSEFMKYRQPIPNIHYYVRMNKDIMNGFIKKMQCGLRLNKHDGFSEITAKSILWGQYPITYLYNPKIDQYTADDCGRQDCVQGLNNLISLLKKIPKKRKPNLKARQYYYETLNNFPWNTKKH